MYPGSELKRFADRVLVVIVIYRMRIDETPAWRSLSQAVDLFLYDNSPESQQPPETPTRKVVYRHDASNRGVSKAYNEGFQLAFTGGKSWLLLLDQDTTLPANLLDAYENAVETNPGVKIFVPSLRDKIGLISPFRYLMGKGIRIQSISKGIHSWRRLRFVNSGLMVDVELFKAAGGYDERFPMDFSDLSFIERLKSRTQNFFVVPSECGHVLSSESKDGNVEQALSRFITLRNAARLYKKEISGIVILAGILLPRAFKLFLVFRDVRFIKLAFAK